MVARENLRSSSLNDSSMSSDKSSNAGGNKAITIFKQNVLGATGKKIVVLCPRPPQNVKLGSFRL